jgi:hypothetical protein
MAVLIRLRDPDTGKSSVYDPKEYDISGMLKDGFTRAGDVMIAAHSRAMPTRKQQETLTPAETQVTGATQPTYAPDPGSLEEALAGAQQAPGPMGGDPGPISLNTVAGAAGMMLAPEVAVPAWLAKLAAASGPASSIVSALPQVASRAASAGATTLGANLANEAVGGQPTSLGEKLVESGKQSAFSIGGDILAGTAGKVARGVMGAAAQLAPEQAMTALQEGIPATRQGFDKLMGKLGDYGNRAMAMVRRSAQSGATHDPIDILNGAGPDLVGGISDNQTHAAPDLMGKVRELANKFVDSHTGRDGVLKPMTPMDLLKMKQDYQKMAEPLYAKVSRREVLDPNETATLQFAKSMADNAQKVLENTVPDMIDVATGKSLSFADANAETSRLIQLKDALFPKINNKMEMAAQIAKRSALPAAGATTGAVLGYRQGGWKRAAEAGLAGGLATSPAFLSHLALLMNSPAAATLLRQVPRGVGATQ